MAWEPPGENIFSNLEKPCGYGAVTKPSCLADVFSNRKIKTGLRCIKGLLKSR
jgi:hypothetical protein